ncbi:MAG TPA: DNA polymerase III subunit epsilon [Roseiarcus sp.]|jgi:DNA polymerase-3 subunit epsilon
MREIVLDTETTGLDPAEGHRVLEIGAVEIVHQSLTGKVFHTLINPERDVPQDAVRVHGHSGTALMDKPVFASIVDDFLAFIGDSKLVIHNAEFDMRFVNAELTRLGLATLSMDRVVDTLALARKRHPGAPASLDALCDRYRIDRSRRVRHGALLDAEILVEVYCELSGGRQRSLLLGDALGEAEVRVVVVAPSSSPRPPRISLIEQAEANAHVRYLESFGRDAVWLRYMPQPA